MRPRMLAFAESFGVTGMGMNDWLPNTRRALAIAELSRDQGKLAELRASAMDAYWRHGANLEDDADLSEIAKRAGLDPAEAIAASRSPKYLERVRAARMEASARGVSAIPTFFFGDEAVVGCQPYEVLEGALASAE